MLKAALYLAGDRRYAADLKPRRVADRAAARQQLELLLGSRRRGLSCRRSTICSAR